MNIGLNGQKLLIENPAGPEKYTYNLYNALSKIDHENKYIIYFETEPTQEFFKRLTNNNRNFKYKYLEKKLSWTQVSLATELFKNPVDIFFTPIHTIPVIHPQKLNIVSMIHGLEYIYDHKNVVKFFTQGQHERHVCTNSEKVIVPTTVTKTDILKKHWRKVYDQKVVVIPEGVSDEFYKREESEITRIKQKYSLDKYVFFLSTIQPRKNIIRLIEAFAKVVLKDPELELVIAGKKGWGYEEILKTPEKLNIEDKVKFIGRIPDEDRAPLLSGSRVYINPALKEGFGLPILEAMSCETPSVVSDIPPFREIAGDSVMYFNPEDTNNMADVIETSVTNYPKYLISEAKEISKNFSWEKTAQKTLEVFKELA